MGVISEGEYVGKRGCVESAWPRGWLGHSFVLGRIVTV